MNSIAAPSALIPARSGVPPSRPSGMRSAPRCGPPGPSRASPDAGAAAGQERRQLRAHPPPRVQHPRPRDPEHLVPGDHREVAAELVDVDRDVPRALGAVEAQPDRRAEPPPQLLQRGQSAEHVVHMGHRDQPGARETFGRDVGSVRLAGCGHRVRDQRDPQAEPGQHLPQVQPGVDVRDVVQRAVQDLVPVGQVGRAPRPRDSVQPRGGARREHDLLRARGAEEPGGLRADLGDPLRSAGRPRIGTAPGVGSIRPAVTVSMTVRGFCVVAALSR